MPKVSGSCPRCLRAATTRASARADTIGSRTLPSAASAMAACKRGRHRDGVAVHAQAEGRNDRHLDVTDAEARCDRNRRYEMGRVEQADVELVAHVRPRHLAHQIDIQPFLRRKPFVHGDDQRGRIGERYETNPELHRAAFHLRSSVAVITAWATSAILRFSFMAVLRSAAYACSSDSPLACIRMPLARSMVLRASSAVLAWSSSS